MFRKINQNDHYAVYKWVTSFDSEMTFQGVNAHPKFSQNKQVKSIKA